MFELHIDDFCKDTALILIFLYRQFPRKSTLCVEDISGADEPDEFGLHSKRHQGCFSTMLWLADTGYIKYSQTIRDEAIDEAYLTQKSLLILCKPSQRPLESPPKDELSDNGGSPKSIATTHTNYQTLAHVLKHGSSMQISDLVMSLLNK